MFFHTHLSALKAELFRFTIAPNQSTYSCLIDWPRVFHQLFSGCFFLTLTNFHDPALQKGF